MGVTLYLHVYLHNVLICLLLLMFLCRILLLSLAAVAHAQYHQFGEQLQTAHGSDCALLLSGPGRSSVYDYNVNLFRGTL